MLTFTTQNFIQKKMKKATKLMDRKFWQFDVFEKYLLTLLEKKLHKILKIGGQNGNILANFDGGKILI